MVYRVIQPFGPMQPTPVMVRPDELFEKSKQETMAMSGEQVLGGYSKERDTSYGLSYEEAGKEAGFRERGDVSGATGATKGLQSIGEKLPDKRQEYSDKFLKIKRSCPS